MCAAGNTIVTNTTFNTITTRQGLTSEKNHKCLSFKSSAHHNRICVSYFCLFYLDVPSYHAKPFLVFAQNTLFIVT